MKTYINSLAKTAAVLLIAVVYFTSASIIAAGGDDLKSKGKKYKRAVASLELGAQSDNLGLKKSSIYYIGLYNMADASDALLKQLKKEKDPEVKVLIAFTLFKLGEEKGYKAILNLAEKDENLEVKKVCNELNKIVNSQIVKMNKTNY